MDAVGQHQNGAPVRHAGEAETAIAIGLDRHTAGEEGGQARAVSALVFATFADQSRLVPRMISTGEAMKIDE